MRPCERAPSAAWQTMAAEQLWPHVGARATSSLAANLELFAMTEIEDAIVHVNIRMTDAAGNHLNEDFATLGLWRVRFDGAQWAARCGCLIRKHRFFLKMRMCE